MFCSVISMHSAYTYRKLTIANRRFNWELKKTHANVRAGCIALFAVACLKSMSLKWTFLSQFLFYDSTNVGNGGATNCRHFYHFSLVSRAEIHLFSMQQLRACAIHTTLFYDQNYRIWFFTYFNWRITEMFAKYDPNIFQCFLFILDD